MSERGPWIAAEAGVGTRKHAPATLRNRDVITDILRDILPKTGSVLELASGSGEHIVHFAQALPALEWQPSDPDAAARRSIAARIADAGLINACAPIDLDAASDEWPVARADAILCINMIHISPWMATEGMIRGASKLLPPGGSLYLYGPFVRSGVPTAESNRAFDRDLKSRNADWGLRSLEDIVQLAACAGLVLKSVIGMPANNLSVIFRRG